MTFPPELVRKLKAEEKVRTFREMQRLVRDLSSAGATIVLAQGVFDLVDVHQ